VVCGIYLTGNPVFFSGSFDKHEGMLADTNLKEKKKSLLHSFSGTTKHAKKYPFVSK
jgi:hypothetical protein